MAEDFHINSTLTKKEKYESLFPQIKALIEVEKSAIANMANVSAALKETFNFWWVGFYLVEEDELVLGPFQGPVACTRIQKGKGVCGTSWKEKKTLVVKDVNEFPGHIACSANSKSEIVIPGIDISKSVCFVLDVDSEHLSHFDDTDQTYLAQICQLIIQIHFN